MLEDRIMNILAFMRLVRGKVDKFNYAVDNPIYSQDNYNPFSNAFDKTYVWIEKSDNDDELS
jgi:hypothetical protein